MQSNRKRKCPPTTSEKSKRSRRRRTNPPKVKKFEVVESKDAAPTSSLVKEGVSGFDCISYEKDSEVLNDSFTFPDSARDGELYEVQFIVPKKFGFLLTNDHHFLHEKPVRLPNFLGGFTKNAVEKLASLHRKLIVGDEFYSINGIVIDSCTDENSTKSTLQGLIAKHQGKVATLKFRVNMKSRLLMRKNFSLARRLRLRFIRLHVCAALFSKENAHYALLMIDSHMRHSGKNSCSEGEEKENNATTFSLPKLQIPRKISTYLHPEVFLETVHLLENTSTMNEVCIAIGCQREFLDVWLGTQPFKRRQVRRQIKPRNSVYRDLFVQRLIIWILAAAVERKERGKKNDVVIALARLLDERSNYSGRDRSGM
eukprot:g2796.t1